MRDEILDIKNCKKIAIMGGTFDPIHYGHLVAAETVRQELGIEKVLFIPTGRPPHKNNKTVEHDEHRYLMTVLATANNPYFNVSRIEIDRPGITYTIDTIKSLKTICSPKAEIFFITGADAINEILTWKNAEELLKICRFVAVTRPGYDKDLLLKKLKSVENSYKINLTFIEVPALSISSTDIRNRVIAEKPIKYLLPDSVEHYIIKFGLYKTAFENKPLFTFINQKLHKALTPKRFAHTQGVAQEAAKLAKVWGVNPEKAYTAGLLHDCAKNFTTEKTLELCKKYNVELDETIKKQPDLAHSFLGAAVAEKEYLITDSEILNAIKYHTTGRADMSLLEKIIYIADMIEPNRKSYNGLELIRKTAYENLNKAVYLGLKQTIDFNKEKSRLIHQLSLSALNYYENQNK